MGKRPSVPIVVRATTAGALVVASMFVAAMVPAAAQKETSPDAPWSVRYADGSGNGYRFWKDPGKEAARFEYTPVQPEDSSSGIYSGGKPMKGTLSVRQAGDLWRHLRQLEGDTTLHSDARQMGTGAFILKERHGTERKFIIRRGPALQRFDAFLARFRRPSR